MANRLLNETSPYLLQHADNPVDWHPWGNEALERAKLEDKPILLSIGYAACHWCHVMAHESFEDPATATVMNEHFVNVKVDREERPDIDSIYMHAVQAMTGHGGWPMTMFLTPDGMPFYAGTYFPPQDRHGMPAFTRVLTSVAQAWRDRRPEVMKSAAAIQNLYDRASSLPFAAPEAGADPTVFDRAYHGLAAQFDARHGGFGGAPKFPPTMSLEFLLNYSARTGEAHALEMVRTTFQRMSRGGIYDQIGGGFARYAVDAIWLVPHFEKMLYDNALLVRLGAHLWQATRDDEVRRVVDETITWLAREMVAADGGFCSSLDADSDGHEGKFYVWSADEIDQLLGADAAVAKAFWGVTVAGNFEGKNILHVAAELDASEKEVIDRARAKLLAARGKRVRPGRDDKVLASWNGLMLRALAEAARIFENEAYRRLAVDNAEFIFRTLVVDGRVRRSYNRGASKIDGFLEDYAALGLAALSLYELTFDPVWLMRAKALRGTLVTAFWDESARTFYDTAADAEHLITRPSDPTDNAIPSGMSLATELLLRIAEHTGDKKSTDRAHAAIAANVEGIARYPNAFGHMLCAANLSVHGATELAIVGDPVSEDTRALLRVAAHQFVPSLVMACGAGDDRASKLLQDRTMIGGRATAYLCRNYTCEQPATDPAALRRQFAAIYPAIPSD